MRLTVRFRSILFVSFVFLATTLGVLYLGPRTFHPIKPFLIYYGGLPVHKSHLRQFVHRIDGYSVVVLGTGLDHPAAMRAIIQLEKKNHKSTRFYGYISIGVTHGGGNKSYNEVKRGLESWKKGGAYGILFDTAGPDFGVTKTRLRTMVQIAHSEGLSVLINSWYPEAVLGVGLTKFDGYLAENWYMSDGRIRSTPPGASYIRQVRRSGIPVYMTATGATTITSLHQPTLQNWILGTHRIARGQYIAISDENYSADTDYILPSTTIKHILTRFLVWVRLI